MGQPSGAASLPCLRSSRHTPPGGCVKSANDQRNFNETRWPGKTAFDELPQCIATKDRDSGDAGSRPSHNAAHDHCEQCDEIELNTKWLAPGGGESCRRNGMSNDKI